MTPAWCERDLTTWPEGVSHKWTTLFTPPLARVQPSIPRDLTSVRCQGTEAGQAVSCHTHISVCREEGEGVGLPGLVPRIHRGLHVVHHHDTVYMVYTLTVMSMLLVMPHPDLSDRKSMICSSIPGLHLPHLVSLLPSQ